jgi:acyl-CoA synthetase (AMP-forming)/AMP-acid ligase II/acyl carrier protein
MVTRFTSEPTTKSLDNADLVELLTTRAASDIAPPAYVFLENGETESSQRSWRDLDRRARAIAAELLQRRLSPGSRVMLLFPQCLEFIDAFFGCLYAGMIAVPAYPPLQNQKMARLRAIHEDAHASIALTTSDRADDCTRRFKEGSLDIDVLAVDAIPDTLGRDFTPASSGPAALAFLQYTSGSTGSPKGVMVSHRNLLANLRDQAVVYRTTPASVMVSWLPAFHDLGLIYGLLLPLYGGFRCYLMAPTVFYQRPVRWLAAITKYRATHAGGPNSAYDLCVRNVSDADCEALALSSWVSALNGAEPVRVETQERFKTRFARCGFGETTFSPSYGLAEATLVVSALEAQRPTRTHEVDARALERGILASAPNDATLRRTLATCGRLLPQFEARIVNADTGRTCADREIGELWVRGPSVASGYWNRADATSETFPPDPEHAGAHWLRTGDLAAMVDGDVLIAGRYKDLIIRHGKNYYPQDIEWAASVAHPALQGMMGAAFSDDAAEEWVVLVHEVARSHLRSLAVPEVAMAIRRAVLEHIELAIDEVVLVRPGQVLRTSSGKIQRRACRQARAARTLDVLGVWTGERVQEHDLATARRDSGHAAQEGDPRDIVRSLLVGEIACWTRLEPARIRADRALQDFDLDSLALSAIALKLEQALGIPVSVRSFRANHTIETFCSELNKELAKSRQTVMTF